MFGSTYELRASVHSEFWGDPNDPNRTVPISQRSWMQMGLLVGGTALEIAPAKAFALGGRTVKFLGKQALKTPYAQKTLQFASNRVTSKAVRTTKIANEFSIPDAGSHIANQVPFHFKGGSVNLDVPSAVIRETYLYRGDITTKY